MRVCVVLVCACCFECICIPYTFNYYLPCTRCNSSSSSGSRNASTTNKQTAHTKILTKYATHTHRNAYPPPTWCFLLAICIKDFYARCKQCQGVLEEMGTAKCAANQCQTWPGQCMQIICVCIIRHKAQKEWEKESEEETREYFVLRSYHSTRHVTRLGKRAHVTIARVKWNYANINVSLTTLPRVYSAFNAPQTTSEICPAAAPF